MNLPGDYHTELDFVTVIPYVNLLHTQALYRLFSETTILPHKIWF